ncbi:MAG: hypothetical protein LUG26_05495 [Ruminococcus sp.]|nr:hypothetical protein [Ruminococcus sp.]
MKKNGTPILDSAPIIPPIVPLKGKWIKTTINDAITLKESNEEYLYPILLTIIALIFIIFTSIG